MGCFSSPKVEIPPPPAPTAAEEELNRTQLELGRENLALLKQQRAEEAAGRAAFERAVGRPYAEYMADLAKSTQDINAAFLERYKKALAGELPVDPTLERALTEGEATLQEQIRRQFGPGGETSTPAIQTLQEYRKRATETRHAARRGEISAAEQHGYATSPLSWIPGVFKQTPMETPTQTADLLNQYRRERMAQYGGELTAARLNAARKPAWMNALELFGPVVGQAGAGAILGGAGRLGPGIGAASGAGLGALMTI
jgi:hypothetical protein